MSRVKRWFCKVDNGQKKKEKKEKKTKCLGIMKEQNVSEMNGEVSGCAGVGAEC